MKTFLHIVIGFVLGVVCTLGVLAVIATATSSKMQEEIKVPVSHFDAKTKKGKVHIWSKTSMSLIWSLLL